jgi:tetratricopeptide (TPR) repeat protein
VARDQKLAEARELSQRGAKHLETSVFQWTPDHVAAASFFERSAESYRAAGDLENARLMYVGSADSHDASNASAAAAVVLVKAAKVAHDQNKFKDATKLYLRAAESWGLHGDREKCADCWFRAAVEIEDTNLAKSLTFYRKAVDLAYPLDTPVEALSTLHPTALDLLREYWRVLLRRELWPEALSLARRLLPLYSAFESLDSLCKTMCAITILQLQAGDVVAAHETFLQEHLSSAAYRTSSECRLAENLVMAFVHLDIDALESAKSSSDMQYVDKEVVKIGKGLSLFAVKNAVEMKTAVSVSAPSPAEEEAAALDGRPPLAAPNPYGVEEDEIDLT